MAAEEILHERIQQLETHYANRLAEGAGSKELSNIYAAIKALKKQLIMVSTVDNTEFQQQ